MSHLFTSKAGFQILFHLVFYISEYDKTIKIKRRFRHDEKKKLMLDTMHSDQEKFKKESIVSHNVDAVRVLNRRGLAGRLC
jgi:hypothetical protein